MSDHRSERSTSSWRRGVLAAPFVLTVSVTGCEEPKPEEPQYRSYERDGVCYRERTNFRCKPGRTCNPPPPREIPCPPELEAQAKKSREALASEKAGGDAKTADAKTADAKTGAGT